MLELRDDEIIVNGLLSSFGFNIEDFLIIIQVFKLPEASSNSVNLIPLK